MQDIRKPYTRSRSSNDLQSRVEQFETARYRRDDYDEEPVTIPVKKTRRDLNTMEMYPRRSREEELYEDETAYEETEDRRYAPRRDIRPRHSRRRSAMGTLAFIFGMFALVIAVILYTYVFDSAKVTIVPKYKDANNINQTFVFTRNQDDATGIPFVIASTSISKTKMLALSESRKVESKASGKIIIYNNYDANPQKLIKNTRFESVKGKIYRINQSVDVPGKKGSTPGSVEVTIYADSSGADYNIDNTTFTIPGFAGTARQSAFYAKTKGPITGGASGNKSLASLSDLNAAKDSLAIELDKEVRAEVTKIKKEGYVPLYSAVEVVYDDNEEEVLQGATGIYKVTATGVLILAQESAFAEAVAKTLGDYDNAPVRITNTDDVRFVRNESERITGSTTISILLEGTPRIVWESDADAIKEMLKGQKRDDFKPLMKTVASVESAEIAFSPLWLSHFPSELTKLEVVEKLPTR